MKRACPLLQTALLFAAVPASFSAAQNVPGTQAALRPKNNDAFLSGAPFSFEQLQRLLGENPIPLRRRREAIQSRGLSFSPTSQQIEKLRAAGVSEDMLKVIKSSVKSTGPSIPAKPRPQGTLSLTCAPLECEITLNGTALGTTENGTLEVKDLSAGTWTIDFKKAGYIGSQSTARVETDKTTPVSAVLEPDRKTQEAYGAELFQKVLSAIGGEDGIKALASVQAIGSTTIGVHNGKSLRWTLAMRNKPDRALFQVRAGDGVLHEVAFDGSEYKVSKKVKGQDVQDLPTSFGLIRDHQLAALIGRLQNPQFTMLANHDVPVDGDEFALVAEGGTGKIFIGLDDHLRPQRVRITTATGVGSAMVTYSDYFVLENVSYPKSLQIKPEGWQQGIDVRFDKVELSLKLNDNDYKLRGKPLANF
jgi:PEGA domain